MTDTNLQAYRDYGGVILSIATPTLTLNPGYCLIQQQSTMGLLLRALYIHIYEYYSTVTNCVHYQT